MLCIYYVLTVQHKKHERKSKHTFFLWALLSFPFFSNQCILQSNTHWTFIEHNIFIYIIADMHQHTFFNISCLRNHRRLKFFMDITICQICDLSLLGICLFFNCLICSLCSLWFIDKTLRGVIENPLLAIWLFGYFCPPCDSLKWTNSRCTMLACLKVLVLKVLICINVIIILQFLYTLAFKRLRMVTYLFTEINFFILQGHIKQNI